VFAERDSDLVVSLIMPTFRTGLVHLGSVIIPLHHVYGLGCVLLSFDLHNFWVLLIAAFRTSKAMWGLIHKGATSVTELHSVSPRNY
jgi:hypothetical protein